MRLNFTTFLFLFFLIPLSGQNIQLAEGKADSSQLHLVILKSGERYLGKNLSIQNEVVFIEFRENQVLEFPLAEVSRIEQANKRGARQGIGPAFMHLMTTAFNFKKGELEYENVQFLWNSINYGISDHFSIGGGFVIPFAFTLKLKGTAPVTDQFRLGVHFQSAIPFVSGSLPISLFQGVATIGQEDKYLNVNYGYLFPWESGTPGLGVGSLGGGLRISQRVFLDASVNLISEEESTYLFPTFNFNYFGRNNRLSMGVVVDAAQESGLYSLPVVSFVSRF